MIKERYTLDDKIDYLIRAVECIKECLTDAEAGGGDRPVVDEADWPEMKSTPPQDGFEFNVRSLLANINNEISMMRQLLAQRPMASHGNPGFNPYYPDPIPHQYTGTPPNPYPFSSFIRPYSPPPKPHSTAWPAPPNEFLLAAMQGEFSVLETHPVPLATRFLDALLEASATSVSLYDYGGALYLVYLGQYDGYRDQTMELDLLDNLPASVRDELTSHAVGRNLLSGMRFACRVFVSQVGMGVFLELTKNFNPE